MKAFKAYDIRGQYPGDWNADDAYKIGYYLPKLLKTDKILIGRDSRLSSDEIFDYLSRGITDAGADVIDMGYATTPMVYWATVKLNLRGSVQITASHNPKHHNGLKVSGKGALPIGYADGLEHIEKWMKDGVCLSEANKGDISKINLKTEYLEFLKSRLPDLAKIRIAIDCSDGMAGLFARDIYGDDVIYINEKPDGNFPGHDPNPLNPNNIVQLQETVVDNDCDLGVIFDGDADRVMFVDENGKFISPDLMLAVLGHKFLDGKEKIRVLQDIRTSKSVGEYLSQFGAEMHVWKVGRAFAAPRLKEIDGLFGGELAGHYYFKEFSFSDSGILASIYILEVLSNFIRKGKTVSSVISSISPYANSGEINFVVEEKIKAITAVVGAVKKTESPLKEYSFDGIRLEFEDWWFNIRPSNTEPYLRFIAEAKSIDLLNEKVTLIRNIIKDFVLR